MLRKLLSIYLFVALTTGACNDGCLQCSSGDCMLCDTENFYFLDYSSSSSCTQLPEDKNCEIPNQGYSIGGANDDDKPLPDSSQSNSNPERRLDYSSNHICFRCKKDYFYNEGTDKCAKVPSGDKIKNCVFYYYDKSCWLCKAKYTSDETSCDPLDKDDVIDNCLYQYNQNRCSECKSGYNLSYEHYESNPDDPVTCIKSALPKNCALSTNILCKECVEDYG